MDRIPTARPPRTNDEGEPVLCPRCGGIYEAAFTVNGQTFGGHVVAGAGCTPRSPEMLRGERRDARARRAARRDL